MKSLVRWLIKLLIFILVIDGIIFSVYKSGNDEIVILKDIKNNKVIQSYSSTYNFIWQGLLPWNYVVVKIPIKSTALFNIHVKIPSLSSLNDDLYVIKQTANISYQLDKTNLPDPVYLNSKNDIETYIMERSSKISETVLMGYIEPVYDKSVILKNEKNIVDTLTSELVRKLKNLGVIVEKLEFISPGYFPDNRLYAEGLIQNKEMRDLDFSNRKEEILLSKKLLKEKYENELYFEKLLKMSSVLKDNPDILKFIYIDKMGDKIKVIISSDKTGLPAMFNEVEDKTKPDVKRDVDNLR